jgi:hypothetical protein
MTSYFLFLDDSVQGPLSAHVIESMLQAGTILSDTPVAAEGASDWTTTGQLFNCHGQTTPPSHPLNVNPGKTAPRAMSPRGLPALKPKQKSVWPGITSALVVTAILAFALYLHTRRANHFVALPGTTPPVGQIMAAPTPAADPAHELRTRAEAGNAHAQYQLAMTCPNSGNYSIDDNSAEIREMIHWLKKSAGQGHPQAQHNLALCYDYGKGVTKDDAEAVRWHRKAAIQGNASSGSELGLHYEHGFGVPQDAAMAAKWYREAAIRGDELAPFRLGLLYLEGNGVPKDLVQALMWLELSPQRGYPEQKRIRDACDRELTAEQIAEAKRLAREWKP